MASVPSSKQSRSLLSSRGQRCSQKASSNPDIRFKSITPHATGSRGGSSDCRSRAYPLEIIVSVGADDDLVLPKELLQFAPVVLPPCAIERLHHHFDVSGTWTPLIWGLPMIAMAFHSAAEARRRMEWLLRVERSMVR